VTRQQTQKTAALMSSHELSMAGLLEEETARRARAATQAAMKAMRAAIVDLEVSRAVVDGADAASERADQAYAMHPEHDFMWDRCSAKLSDYRAALVVHKAAAEKANRLLGEANVAMAAQCRVTCGSSDCDGTCGAPPAEPPTEQPTAPLAEPPTEPPTTPPTALPTVPPAAPPADAENPELAAQAKAAEAAEAARAAEAAAEAAPEVWEWDDNSPFDLLVEVETMACAVALHEAGFVRCVRCAHVLLQQAQELNQQLPSVKTLELSREYLDAWQRSLVLRDTNFILIEAEAWLDAVIARPLCTACTACGGSVLTAAGTSATMEAAAALCEANRIVEMQDIRKSIVM
jgi:hypothetical protein